MDPGDRMVLWCEGGPAMVPATTYPPPLELAASGGMYVLVDDGPPEQWRYAFLADDRPG